MPRHATTHAAGATSTTSSRRSSSRRCTRSSSGSRRSRAISPALTYGHRPGRRRRRSSPRRRARAADHRALQLLRRRDGGARGRERPDRHRTQPPGEGLPRPRRSPTRAATSRCSCTGCATSASPTRRRRSSGAPAAACCSSSSRLLELVGRQGLGGGDLRAERDPRGAGVRRLPHPRAGRRPGHARGAARAVDQGRAPPHRLRRERARAAARRRAAHPRPPRPGEEGARPSGARQPRGDDARRSASRRRAGAGSAAPTSSRSSAWDSRDGRPARARGRRAAPGERPRQRFILEDTGFDEVPKKYRKLLPQVAGRRRLAGAERGDLPGVQGGHPLDAASCAPATASTACRACRAWSWCATSTGTLEARVTY